MAVSICALLGAGRRQRHGSIAPVAGHDDFQVRSRCSRHANVQWIVAPYVSDPSPGVASWLGLLMGWVEIDFMGWVLKWSVLNELKWVVLVNGVGRGRFYINAG